MIDICCAIYRNYELTSYFLDFHRHLTGQYRFLLADATPKSLKQPEFYEIFAKKGNNLLLEVDFEGDHDGIVHGEALNFLIDHAETDIIGTIDFDFFWVQPDILEFVENAIKKGVQAIGCAGWYPDWLTRLDPRHPDRAGHLAPVSWGQFLTHEIATATSFVSTIEESQDIRETGWRARKFIIDNKINNLVFPGFKFDDSPPMACFFGDYDKPRGVHLMRGSQREIPPIEFEWVEAMRQRWQP